MLPDGTVSYSGDYYMEAAENDFAEADISITVALGSAGVTGSLSCETDALGDDVYFAGTVTGNIVDGPFFLKAVIPDAAIAGDLDMIGAIYDDSGRLTGAMAGTFAGATAGGELATLAVAD